MIQTMVTKIESKSNADLKSRYSFPAKIKISIGINASKIKLNTLEMSNLTNAVSDAIKRKGRQTRKGVLVNDLKSLVCASRVVNNLNNSQSNTILCAVKANNGKGIPKY